jgi:hypothetical protein
LGDFKLVTLDGCRLTFENSFGRRQRFIAGRLLVNFAYDRDEPVERDPLTRSRRCSQSGWRSSPGCTASRPTATPWSSSRRYPTMPQPPTPRCSSPEYLVADSSAARAVVSSDPPVPREGGIDLLPCCQQWQLWRKVATAGTSSRNNSPSPDLTDSDIRQLAGRTAAAAFAFLPRQAEFPETDCTDNSRSRPGYLRATAPHSKGPLQHVKNTHVGNNHLGQQGIQRGLRLFVDANLVHRSGSSQARPQPLAHLVGRYCAGR